MATTATRSFLKPASNICRRIVTPTTTALATIEAMEAMEAMEAIKNNAAVGVNAGLGTRRMLKKLGVYKRKRQVKSRHCPTGCPETTGSEESAGTALDNLTMASSL